MERRDFIEKDPLTNRIITFLGKNPKNAYSIDEITENLFSNVTTKQVQMVISLLTREGLVRTSFKDGKAAYQLKQA